MKSARCAALAASIAATLNAGEARAHIDLQQPEPRAHGTAARGDTDIDVNSNVKNAPCGQGTTGRSERVTTYAPGQRITVRVREENAHVSYLRVRIDLDGADFPLRSAAPPGPESQEEATAAELALGAEGLLAVLREDNDMPGFVHEIDVTLPNVTSNAATLQVVQFMYDDPAAPYYFQCADLVIAEAAAVDAGAAPDDGMSGDGTFSGNAGASAGDVDAVGAGSNDLGSAVPPDAEGAGAASPTGGQSTADGTTRDRGESGPPSVGAGGVGSRMPPALQGQGEGGSACGLSAVRPHDAGGWPSSAWFMLGALGVLAARTAVARRRRP